MGFLRRVLPTAAALVALAALTPARASAGVCELLTAEEIEAIQGDRLTHAKPSAPTRPQFDVAQCFFTTASFDNSISLEITRPLVGAPQGVTPRSFWQASFHRDWQAEADEDSDSARARAEEKAPHRVEGLGEEAFWVGRGGPGGALYILDGEIFVRLAVGGGGDAAAKLERTTRLARRVLERLTG